MSANRPFLDAIASLDSVLSVSQSVSKSVSKSQPLLKSTPHSIYDGIFGNNTAIVPQNLKTQHGEIHKQLQKMVKLINLNEKCL